MYLSYFIGFLNSNKLVNLLLLSDLTRPNGSEELIDQSLMVATDDPLYDLSGEFVFDIAIEVFGLGGEWRFRGTGRIYGFARGEHYLLDALHVALRLLVHF